MVPILQKEHTLLRKKAKEVPLDEILSKKIQDTLKDMKEALASQEDGVAIAAPQIGVPLRMFVVSKNVLPKKDGVLGEDAVFINPIITSISKERESMDEGCLSVRSWYGKVLRAKKVKMRAYNETGKRFERGASGLLSQIFQHETDHLEGILFTDKAKDLHESIAEQTEKHE